MLTKGKMIKALKANGIRKGKTEDGRDVSLEHLKTVEIVKMFYEVIENA
jgi:hypothetical protein